MEWLTEYFDLLLPVALVLMFVFQRMFTREEGEERRQPPSEADEAFRRIQEEIRRKIVARQQGRAEPTPPPVENEWYPDEVPQPPERVPERYEAPPPLRQEWERPIVVESVPPPPPRAASRIFPPSETSVGSDIQDELRVQKERLEEARRAKADALQQSLAKGLVVKKRRVWEISARGESDLRGSLLADLSNRRSLKRAFVLKEVLDRPVGLRERSGVER